MPCISESPVAIWIKHSYDKIRPEMKAPKNPKTDYTVFLSKNESEGLGVALRSATDREQLSFKMLSGDNEHIEYSVFHIADILKLGKKTYTDPAIPICDGKSFSLKKNKTMALFVDFKTTEKTPAGDYSYELGVLDAEGRVLNKIEVKLHVWNFAMPTAPRFQTAMGNHFGQFDHYEMLLEHNLTPYTIPYDLLDERADKYMSDPRVTSFKIPTDFGDENIIEKLTAYYNKIKENPEWRSKAYFYPIDEPSSVEELDRFENRCKKLRELFPDIRITVPYYKNLQISPDLDQIDFMSKYIDLHCPKLALWDDDRVYDEEQKAKYPPFAERMKDLQAKGDTVWAYVCNYPLAPYLNVKVDDDGIDSRVLFWQFYQRDIDGFLYWHSSWYGTLGNGENPWDSVDTFRNGIYGDGILIYTGTGAGLPRSTPVASIRLKIVRDGLDDIQLLYMAEELLGHEWVDKRANSVSKSLTSVDVSSDQLAALRIEIGNAIESALNKK